MTADRADSGLQIAMLSRPGARERNEDACGHWGQGRGPQEGPVCVALADGAGGHGGGDVASQTSVAAVLEAFSASPACTPGWTRELMALANRAVVARQASSDATRDMRSTLVISIFDPARGEAIWGHVGDSRLYCFRDGRILLRTRDHSLYQSMIDAGIADPADRSEGIQRNVLTASLGSLDGFDADVLPDPFMLATGDAFLMCSDGFWGLNADSDMEAALQRAHTPQAWIGELAERIASQGRAGQDNYSAVAVWYGTPDFRTRIMPGATADA